jgi:predicted aspartyl protease
MVLVDLGVPIVGMVLLKACHGCSKDVRDTAFLRGGNQIGSQLIRSMELSRLLLVKLATRAIASGRNLSCVMLEPMPSRITAHLVMVLAALGIGGGVRADDCSIVKIGRAPLIEVRGHYQVPATINGEAPMDFVVDTGAERSTVHVDAAAKLELPARAGPRTYLVGTDGKRGRSYPKVTVERLEFAGLQRTGVVMAMRDTAINGASDARGVIGADLLSDFDVELDYRNNRLSLYRITGCERSGKGFQPWSTPHDVVPLKISSTNILSLPVTIDGKELEMALDTGAVRSKVSMNAAVRKLGLDLERLKAEAPRNISHSTSGATIQNYTHRFGSVQIGEGTYDNIEIKISEIKVDPYDGLLGLDFLRSRKVWVSYATRQLLVQRKP